MKSIRKKLPYVILTLILAISGTCIWQYQDNKETTRPKAIVNTTNDEKTKETASGQKYTLVETEPIEKQKAITKDKTDVQQSVDLENAVNLLMELTGDAEIE